MNAKELRIGLTVKQGTIELLELRKSEIVCIRTENGTYSKVEPIPLTEEWFIDHGFQKDKDGVINIGKSLYWLPSGYWGNTGVIQIAFGYSPLINCPCEFVHQLQNIYFAFYGKEINIELS